MARPAPAGPLGPAFQLQGAGTAGRSTMCTPCTFSLHAGAVSGEDSIPKTVFKEGPPAGSCHLNSSLAMVA